MSLRRQTLTPEQRSTRARAAALTRWSRLTEEQRHEQTQAARDGFQARFDAAPNPEAAKRAHMTGLALKSSRSRKTA